MKTQDSMKYLKYLIKKNKRNWFVNVWTNMCMEILFINNDMRRFLFLRKVIKCRIIVPNKYIFVKKSSFEIVRDFLEILTSYSCFSIPTMSYFIIISVIFVSGVHTETVKQPCNMRYSLTHRKEDATEIIGASWWVGIETQAVASLW